MHIPDQFVTLPVAASAGILSAGTLAYACWRGKRVLPSHRVPLLGLSAAFIFAAQMVNFPVVSGTSGHLIGGCLAAILLGPSAAMIAMAAVILVQCFLFADGGVTALGANLLNMAILAPLAGYSVWRAFSRLLPGRTGQAASAAAGAWLSTVVASAACAGQVALSGKIQGNLVLPAMLGVHSLIGLGEAAITMLVLLSLWKVRPELLGDAAGVSPRDAAPILGYGLAATIAMALFVSPFACPWPDGLEQVAQRLGFALEEERPVLSSWLPDYQVPGISSDLLSTGLAGLAGVAVLFAIAFTLSWVLKRREARPPGARPDSAA